MLPGSGSITVCGTGGTIMKKYVTPFIELAYSNQLDNQVLNTSGYDTPIDTTGDADDY